MERLNRNIYISLKQTGVKHRINANPGVWLCFLLPLAVIQSILRHPNECTLIYKLNGLISIGLILTSLTLLIQCYRLKKLSQIRGLNIIPSALTTAIFYVCVTPNFAFSLVSGFVAGIFYYKLLLFVLRKASYSFTLGEAALVTQSLILFIYSSGLTVYEAVQHTPYKHIEITTLIAQLGLLCVLLLCILTYTFTTFRGTKCFYTLFVLLVIAVIFVPTYVLLKQNIFIWLFNFLLASTKRVQMLVYWMVLIGGASLIVNYQITHAKKATTCRRKAFHVFAILAYFPSMLHECALLHFATLVALGLMIFIELLRLLNIPPLGQHLQNGFVLFRDEKDADLALTPLYLLTGCSLPLWLHPTPCDLTDSIGFNLLPLISGLLTVGVGDTAASVLGTFIGRHKWPGTMKSVEGTLACVLAQACCVFLLVYTGFIRRGHLQIIKSGIAILTTSLIEAKSSQIDNLSLPLIMYLIVV